jgi:hypothetical protein
LSCYFVVVWRRVLLVLLCEEDADPSRPTVMLSSAIEDECCPQSEDTSPSPPCVSRSKRQGGGQSFSFLKNVCTQTRFTLSKLSLSIPPFMPSSISLSIPPFIPPSISPSTPSVVVPQAPLLGEGGKARQQACGGACRRHDKPPFQRATANLFPPTAASTRGRGPSFGHRAGLARDGTAARGTNG